MSLLDKIKAFFAGDANPDADYHEPDHPHDHAGHTHDEHGSDEHGHEGSGSSYLQSPSNPDEPVLTPTPEETAAAARAEPPTTTVDSLSEDESATERPITPVDPLGTTPGAMPGAMPPVTPPSAPADRDEP